MIVLRNVVDGDGIKQVIVGALFLRALKLPTPETSEKHPHNLHTKWYLTVDKAPGSCPRS